MDYRAQLPDEPFEAPAMRLPRIRLTIQLLMITIVLAGLVFAGIAARRRQQRALALQTAQVGLQRAEAACREAELTRKVAEIAAAEYEYGIYKQSVAAVDVEISRAELELKAANEVSDTQAGKRAKSLLEQKRNQRATLERDSKVQIKALRSELNRAKADEWSKRTELQKAKAALNRIMAGVPATSDF
jgi:hypothetical protein